jgi:hypothetical protein
MRQKMAAEKKNRSAARIRRVESCYCGEKIKDYKKSFVLFEEKKVIDGFAEKIGRR